jgi:cell division protein FtsW
MARTLKSDKLLFTLTVLLVALGVVMVYSASAATAESPYTYLVRQTAWALVGFGAMFGVMRVDYRAYRRPALIGGLAVVIVTLLIAVFFFPPINGTHRWLSFGFASLQPSELAKLLVVIFTAAILEKRMERVNEIREALLPIAGFTGCIVALILCQPDYGTSAVIVAVTGAMVFLAGLYYRFLIAGALLLLPGALWLIIMSPYRLQRLLSFLDPEADRLGAGYQASQSLIALGSGGVFGRGLMEGVQKLYYLPEAHTDFIYAVIGEELGLVGTSFLLISFAALVWRAARVGLTAPDRFGAFLGLGITMIFALQALVNMSVATALLPTKGIPLPFVSNGGSSLLINMVGIGILLNISQHATVTAGPAGQPKAGWMLESQEA